MVDDSTIIRHILGKILRQLDIEVVEAANGIEALCNIESERPDVAFVDWNMPEMDGYEFIKAVRSDHSKDRIKIVVVTAEAEVDQVIKAVEAGANAYIIKPFTKEVICEKLAGLGFSLQPFSNEKPQY